MQRPVEIWSLAFAFPLKCPQVILDFLLSCFCPETFVSAFCLEGISGFCYRSINTCHPSRLPQLSYPGVQRRPQRLVGLKYWAHFFFQYGSSRTFVKDSEWSLPAFLPEPYRLVLSTQSMPECPPAWIFDKKWEQCQLFSKHTAHLHHFFLLQAPPCTTNSLAEIKLKIDSVSMAYCCQISNNGLKVWRKGHWSSTHPNSICLHLSAGLWKWWGGSQTHSSHRISERVSVFAWQPCTAVSK